MATQVQWRRGTTTQVAAYTGAVGEVVIDTTLHQLVVQDGVTAGGYYAAKATGGVYTNITITGTTNQLTGTILASAGTISNVTLNTPTINSATSVGGTFSTATAVNLIMIGTPIAPTAAIGNSSTQVATTAFVQNAITVSAQAVIQAAAVALGS